MKVLILNGSPKQRSDTFRMTERFLKGLSSQEEQDVTVVHVIEKAIAPCRGCFGCWQQGEGHCLIDDDQNGILDLYRAADLVIWSFPLYCYGMPSHLKALLDRTIPLMKMRMVQLSDGRVQHEALTDLSRLHTLVLCGCGFPDWEGNFSALKLQCKQCFGNLTMVCVPETPMLNVPQAAVVADPLLDRFEQAGAEYAQNLRLSSETVTALETPMIPKEVYVSIVNGN